MVAIHYFTISVTPNRSKKGLVQLKHLSTKIKEVTSNAAITEKNVRRYVRRQISISWTQGAFSCKVASDIDVFIDKPIVQCDVEVVKNSIVDDSK